MAVKDILLSDALEAKKVAERDIGIAAANALVQLANATGLVAEGVEVSIVIHAGPNGPEFPMVTNVRVNLAKPW